MDLLKAENLSFAYPDQPLLWENLTFSLPKGSFTLLAGAGGSGKSSLLRHLVHKLEPFGHKSGHLYFSGTRLDRLPAWMRVQKIAFVMQNPEDQIVTDSVWHELAFGLENQGVDPQTMRLRIAEIANFFGMQTWFQQRCDQLSGGQKQLLNLAAVLLLQPELLVLDEPSAQLDPIAADEFFHILQRVNRELGVTILMTDHRLGRMLPLADRVLLLEDKGLRAFRSPRAFAAALQAEQHPLSLALPAAARISFALAPDNDPLPVLEVREVREQLAHAFAAHAVTASVPEAVAQPADKPPARLLARLDEVSFSYSKHGDPVLDHLSLDIEAGKFLAVLGGNGSGKSTLLACLAGLLRPQSGRIHFYKDGVKPLFGRGEAPLTALLPQNPRLLFARESVIEQMEEIWQELTPAARRDSARLLGYTEEAFSPLVLLEAMDLGDRAQFHPGDLSGGELQRAALATVLLYGAELLLLDEPGKGLDAEDLAHLGEILDRLRSRGITIVAVSHDLEFCAAHADTCALLFRGETAAVAEPHAFFSGHYFYTTDACRAAAGFLPGCITSEEVVSTWQQVASS